MKAGMEITVGKVVRWFNVDWKTISQLREAVTDGHELIMDAIGEIPNATEVNSGHTGFNVAFEDENKTDDEIIAAIRDVILKIEV